MQLDFKIFMHFPQVFGTDSAIVVYLNKSNFLKQKLRALRANSLENKAVFLAEGWRALSCV